MKFHKLLTLLLCVSVLLSVATGCTGPNNGEDNPEEPDTSVEESSPPVTQDAQTEKFDFDRAYSAFSPDTVMFTAGDYEVKWDELFFYICSSITYLENNGGFNWSDNAYDGMTYENLILDYATDDALSYKAILFGSNLLGVALSDKEYAEIDEDLKEAADSNGGEEALLELLKTNSHINSLELFRYLLETDFLVSLCYTEMFGENMSLITDEAAAEKTESGGYLMAKHILRLKTEDIPPDGSKSVPLTEAEDILEKLKSYSGGDFDNYFTELMLEHSEDTGGLSSYPNGYLFQQGDMVPEFHDAAAALEIGDFSDIIETTYGYHIIYRLPVDYDAVPFAYYSAGYDSSLRQIAAADIFNSAVSGWIDELTVSYSDEFNSLSLSDIFSSAA